MHVQWLELEGTNRWRVQPEVVTVDVQEVDVEEFHLRLQVINLHQLLLEAVNQHLGE